MTARKTSNDNQKRLNEILNLTTQICKSKGWKSRISNQDKELFKSATITVEKFFSKEYAGETVVGALEIDIVNGTKIRLGMSKTSFYGYGLDNLYSTIKAEILELSWIKENSEKKTVEVKNHDYEIIENILNKFDRAARQFKRRYDNRPTIEVKDEYDVQDALHAIFKCYFDDVRPEEYSPSYAGSSSRVDFLLKKEQIIIEVKIATKRLTDKKIGEQLIIDIKRYETHPDCKSLFCFVYDPEGNINNPIALENDLSGLHGQNGLKVKVIIAPK